METDQKEIRFGIVAVQKGFVTPEQIVEAFEVQLKEDLTTGDHKPIGKIMLDQGVINQKQLHEILRSMKKPGKGD